MHLNPIRNRLCSSLLPALLICLLPVASHAGVFVRSGTQGQIAAPELSDRQAGSAAATRLSGCQAGASTLRLPHRWGTLMGKHGLT